MLKKEQIKQIATLLKIDETKLADALKSTDEVDIELTAGLQTVTEEDLTRIKTAEYSNGKTKGIEIAIKETKEKLNLDFQGKTLDGLIEAANKKALADAKIEPDKKVKEMEADMTNLRSQITTLQGQITEKDGAVNKAKIDRELFKHIPSFGEKALTQDEFIQLMRFNGYDFKFEGNDLVAVKGDEVVKDNLAKPLAVKDVINGFAKEKKLITEEEIVTGRGGSDGKGTVKFTKLSEVKAYYEKQGKSTMGEEFNNEVMKLRADNKEFDLTA